MKQKELLNFALNKQRKPAKSEVAQIIRQFKRHHLAIVGLFIIVFVISAALITPLLPLMNPNQVDAPNRLKPIYTSGHLLGTDQFGRDMLSRLMWGARISLMAGLTSTGIALVIGTTIGLISGYFGRWIDHVLMRMMDVLMAFPYILLAMAIVAGLGPGLFNAMLAIGIVGIPLYARITRASTLSVKEKEYVDAAKSIGANPLRVMLFHVFPNIWTPILVTTTLDFGNKIISTASLSFLGMGTQPPTADWGNMLATGRDYIVAAPHAAFLPGLAIFIVVLAFNFLGDGLRDTFDPRLKE